MFALAGAFVLLLAVVSPATAARFLENQDELNITEDLHPSTVKHWLYGAPGSVEGTFQDSVLPTTPDWQGWTSHDLVNQPSYWQLSLDFAENLNNNGPGNRAMRCGQTPAQQPDWESPGGYGNNWDQSIEFRKTMTDPAVAQLVLLRCYVNYKMEATNDVLLVEYQTVSAGWQMAQRLTGTNEISGTFPAPGSLLLASLSYAANDYPGGDIVVRIRFVSDGYGSDEDKFFQTGSGGCLIDDIEVFHDLDGTGYTLSAEGFESGGPYLWVPANQTCGAGDYAKAFSSMTDTDTCKDNNTGKLGFYDDGTRTGCPPGPGSVSPTHSYGVVGNWVVNYEGGPDGALPLHNEVRSPQIPWDLPGPADDLQSISGCRLKFELWKHLPFENGIFYTWRVRSKDRVSGIWSPWKNGGNRYHGGATGQWVTEEYEVGHLLGVDPSAIQIALGVVDMANDPLAPVFDATISPVFDNVSLYKYQIGGPVWWSDQVNLFQDAFNQSGNTDFSTTAARNALDVRIDASQDVDLDPGTVEPQDYILVNVRELQAGITLDPVNVEMHFALHMNPYFEMSIRPNIMIGGETYEFGAGINGWDIVSGTVAGIPHIVGGVLCPDTYAFLLPDNDFMYPGDVLHYYFEATNSSSEVTVHPGDLGGFGSDVTRTYDRRFTIGALPSITASGQPEILVVNQHGHGDHEAQYYTAFDNLGMIQGQDYDVYTTKAASAGQPNSIGSAGTYGATVAQLADYKTIIVLAGDGSLYLLNDGTQFTGQNGVDDIDLLTDWRNLSGDRNLVFFGDNLATSLQLSSGGPTFLGTMGVQFLGPDVRTTYGSILKNPLIIPTVNAVHPFINSLAVGGPCPTKHPFDEISPLPSAPAAVATHEFTGGVGSVAGVCFDRIVGIDRKVDLTFPFDLGSVFPTKSATGAALLLEEILNSLDHTPGGPPTTVAIPTPGLHAVTAYPNPFNPTTSVSFEIGAASETEVKIYSVRGQLVRVLHDGPLEAGPHRLNWNGRDDRGATVATGIYHLRVESNGETERRKLALIK